MERTFVNRMAVWPDASDSWIVTQDDDILVVDKPEGVPSQAADPDRPDDVVTRLRAHLGGAYLGVHQRLDQDTSGLLVFARRREANAALASQFEGRSVRKTYVACVTGWPAGRERTTLRGAIAAGPGRAMRVTAASAPGAKGAVTRVRVLARCADRAMLELELETGRTHQARVQLADAGAPIAGDALYGGAPAPRLLLHASAIELRHPGAAQRRVRIDSAPPPEFAAWLERGDRPEAVYDDDVLLRRAVARAIQRRWALGRSAPGPRATTAFRLANDAGDGLPRLAVDVYDAWLVAQLYGEDGPWAVAARRERVLDALHASGFDGVYLKVRPRQANVLTREPAEARARLAPPDPVRGTPAPPELEILEDGMPLVVRLGDGLSTGLFLDQRRNRQRVRQAAAGRDVANLFAYTCAFTVAAALGGARRTVSVDVSASALERGHANLVHAGVDLGASHTFVAADVFAWLRRAAAAGERFGLVVLDPPSYSTTKHGRFVAESDYAGLAASAMKVLAPDGVLLACTNHRGLGGARFRRILFAAAREAGRQVAACKDGPSAPDYPIGPGGPPPPTSAWVTLT